MKFEFTRAVEIEPYGSISEGCVCWCSYVDEVTGRIEMNAEGDEPSLLWWNNRIMLEPFDSDDITEALTVSRREVPALPKPAYVPRHGLRYAAALMLAFLIGLAMPTPHIAAEAFCAVAEDIGLVVDFIDQGTAH
jgi:hypothetical protein